MSEVQNNQGPILPENHLHVHEQHEKPAEGITFKGEKTDLRYDPMASVNRTCIKKPVTAKIGDQTVTFGAKEINQVKNDLKFLHENPVAVQRACSLFPAFLGYANNKGVQNPDSLALALEHYAATNEFVENTEVT
ncbi:MAG TPA: hypothetical protein P5556_06705 [Candidatus Gastranaerophilales bacterium]|nr:hypothetical protein [Candidatus Gastranaerophilales bacterium]